MTTGWKRWICVAWLLLIPLSGNAAGPAVSAGDYKSGDLGATSLSVDIKAPPAGGTFASVTDFGTFAALFNAYVAVITSCNELFIVDSNGKFNLISDFVTTPVPVSFQIDTSGVSTSHDFVLKIVSSSDFSDPIFIGAAFYVGLGIDFSEMLRTSRYRLIWTVTDPNAPPDPNAQYIRCSDVSRQISKSNDGRVIANYSIPIQPQPFGFASGYIPFVVAIKGDLLIDQNRQVVVHRIDAVYSFLSTNRYVSYIGGPIPTFLAGASPSSTTNIFISLLENISILELSGASIFIGYGLSSEEMLASKRYGYMGTLP